MTAPITTMKAMIAKFGDQCRGMSSGLTGVGAEFSRLAAAASYRLCRPRRAGKRVGRNISPSLPQLRDRLNRKSLRRSYGTPPWLPIPVLRPCWEGEDGDGYHATLCAAG